MTYQHELGCPAVSDLAARQQAAFVEKYPNYCRKCDGAGGFSYPGSRLDPPEWDDCPQCLGTGKCSLCGHQHGEEWDGEPCEACGIRRDDDHPTLPIFDPCICGVFDPDPL